MASSALHSTMAQGPGTTGTGNRGTTWPAALASMLEHVAQVEGVAQEIERIVAARVRIVAGARP